MRLYVLLKFSSFQIPLSLLSFFLMFSSRCHGLDNVADVLIY